ncbi:MAG: DUF1624 domain-containing protein [Acidobacteria bacterium]|nr:DUF1624 domain-containing protein [Acidobacteriota bacterium]
MSNPTALTQNRTRLDSIDFLRGLVMIIMALDHTRDFFSSTAFEIDPTDLTRTSSALFLTRWITHFCAPVFVFLAGTAAYLAGSRGKSKAALSQFLFTRGVWLIVLELTVIRCLGWYWNFNYAHSRGQVIWAIGWSLIALAGLIHLPIRVIAIFGVVMIAGHNLLDGIKLESVGAWRWLWAILHVPAELEWAKGKIFFTQYPLIPWIGVMAVGYAFGSIFRREQAERNKLFLRLGLALMAAFIVIRGINVYGNPQPWAVQKNWWFSIFSFLNCEKYPPSLLYLLMTLGPAIALLPLLDRAWGKLGQAIITFGRVPLFYYLLHLPLLRVIVVIVAIAKYGSDIFNLPQDQPPPGWGFHLPVVYLIWLGAILLLYPLCRWFAGVKQRSRKAWLSYL